MDSTSQVNVPLRSGGKKMRKRRELDALVAHSLAKRANVKNYAGNGINSQDQLLSPSTDEHEDFTWPKLVRPLKRNHNKQNSFIKICVPLLFVTCSISLGFMYWLYFDLRQQLYEYRQKIEEVSVTSQNLPEALQKWHETSRNFEKNQTKMYAKISEFQRTLETINEDFSQHKLNFNEKKDFSKNQKYVSEFGAKIEAVNGDVQLMTEEFSEYKKIQNIFKADLKDLTNNFSKISLQLFNNTVANCSDIIINVEESIKQDIRRLDSNLSLINSTLSQKSQYLDEELIGQKKHLDELLDTSANTTSHVSSIENDWTKHKENFLKWNGDREQIFLQIGELKNFSAHLENSINDIRTTFIKFETEIVQRIGKLKENFGT